MFRFGNILAIFIIIAYLPSHSQQQQDAGIWNTFSIEKRLNKKFSIEINQELRLKENFTRLNLVYTNLGINYRYSRALKFSLIYRLIEKYTDDDYFSFRHRLMLDIGCRHKISKFTLAYRSRFQTEVRNFHTSEKGKIPEWYWRNKFELKYNLKQFDPYVGTELRYQITDPRNPESDLGWHRIRLFAGIDYSINKRNTFGFYYLMQREWLVTNPSMLYIFGLEYSILLN
jgi:hypothetical protein